MSAFEQTFNKVDRNDGYHGPSRPVIPYKGETTISISEVAVEYSNVYPTIDDDAAVFKMAFNEGSIDWNIELQWKPQNSKEFGETVKLILAYLKDILSLAELKANFPDRNPFGELFYFMTYTVMYKSRSDNRAMHELLEKWAKYYAKLGYVQLYHVFVKADSALYRAAKGLIPLTPELFNHGVTHRMDDLVNNGGYLQCHGENYHEKPWAGLYKSDPILGWSTKDLVDAINAKGDAVFPTYLLKAKRWATKNNKHRYILEVILNEDANTVREVLAEFNNQDEDEDVELPPGSFNPTLSYNSGDGYIDRISFYDDVTGRFQGFLTGRHRNDNVYPVVAEKSPLIVWPPRDHVTRADEVTWISHNGVMRRWNLIAVYRYLYPTHTVPEYNHAEDIPRLLEMSQVDHPLPHVEFYPDTQGKEIAYYHDVQGRRFQIPEHQLNDLTSFSVYKQIRQNADDYKLGLFHAIAKRLGVRCYDDKARTIKGIEMAVARMSGTRSPRSSSPIPLDSRYQ